MATNQDRSKPLKCIVCSKVVLPENGWMIFENLDDRHQQACSLLCGKRGLGVGDQLCGIVCLPCLTEVDRFLDGGFGTAGKCACVCKCVFAHAARARVYVGVCHVCVSVLDCV